MGAAAELMEATKLAGALDKRAIELPSWRELIRELVVRQAHMFANQRPPAALLCSRAQM